MAISRLIRDENLKSCGKTISYLEDINEIWKDIKGYENLYQVSNWGRVKSLQYNNIKILKPRNIQGYQCVILYKYNLHKEYKIHRLVAEAFIYNPYNLPQVNHKDENKANNKVHNLEWCTAKYNVNYGTARDRMKEKMKGRTVSEETRKRMSESLKGKLAGENNPNFGKPMSEELKEKLRIANTGKKQSKETIKKRIDKIAKPINQYDCDGKYIRNWNNAKEIENELGFNHKCIVNSCGKNKFKKQYGYLWRFRTNEDNENICISNKLNECAIKIIQSDLDGNIIKGWDSVRQAELYFRGKQTGNIYRALKSKSNIAFGFKWHYS